MSDIFHKQSPAVEAKGQAQKDFLSDSACVVSGAVVRTLSVNANVNGLHAVACNSHSAAHSASTPSSEAQTRQALANTTRAQNTTPPAETAGAGT